MKYRTLAKRKPRHARDAYLVRFIFSNKGMTGYDKSGFSTSPKAGMMEYCFVRMQNINMDLVLEDWKIGEK